MNKIFCLFPFIRSTYINTPSLINEKSFCALLSDLHYLISNGFLYLF